MFDLSRLRKLSGLCEDLITPDSDEAFAMDDAHYDALTAREQAIEKAIVNAFHSIGLAISDDQGGVHYDEENERAAIVTLDDHEVDLSVLNKLTASGLSTAYKIGFSRNGLLVEFAVSPELDHMVGMTSSASG